MLPTSSSLPNSPSADGLIGLVLAGGQSRRMGVDKGQLTFDGHPQAERGWRLLNTVVGEAFISINRHQLELPPYRDLPSIVDENADAGPAGGLLSAWSQQPGVAWLVLAVDLPLVDVDLLEDLISRRDTDRIATAYRHSDGTIEPACTIWEAAACELVQGELDAGRGSLRRVLEHQGAKLIDPARPLQLESVNTPAERDALLDQFAGSRAEQGAGS